MSNKSVFAVICFISFTVSLTLLFSCGGGSSSSSSSNSPASACLDCHNQDQDNQDSIPASGRRAVANEFPSGTTHAHLNGLVAINDNDCLVCHDQTNHKSGNVTLLDADSAVTYSFQVVSDLNSDPDVSDFCLSCHDADGATRLAEPQNPFGNGNAPQNVAERYQGDLEWYEWYGDFCFGNEGSLRYTNSHHDITDADQAKSGAKLECLNCHSAHLSANTQKLADPFSPTNPWTGSINDFCIKCHDGGESTTSATLPPNVTWGTISVDANNLPCSNPGADCATSSLDVLALNGLDSCSYNNSPWFNNYPRTHEVHGGGSKRAYTNYSGAPAYDIECTVCHDPHGSFTATNPTGNPYMIKDFVDGSMFVDDGNRLSGFNGPPWNTLGVAREVVVQVTPGAAPPPTGSAVYIVGWGDSTGLCTVCHASWLNDGFFGHDSAFGCKACQTCHSHGADYENLDMGNPSIPESHGCSSCGNGVVDGVEQCDDGNKFGGDGCSDTCMTE
mgnify:CR=1 FL=1